MSTAFASQHPQLTEDPTMKTEATTPVNDCLSTATKAATAALGDADNRSVTAAADLSVSVTEAGLTKTKKAAASVTLATESSETPVSK